MGRESFPRRVLLTLKFIFTYIIYLLFVDFPRFLMQRMKKINGQVVVVTGGAMGIGKEVSRKLALVHGAKVCILDVNEMEGKRTVEEITNNGGICYFFKCDISDHKSLQKVANQIYNQLGFIHIVVANAAILRFGEMLDLSFEDYKLSSDVNILGTIYTFKTFLPKMMDAKKGHLVSIGSICSHYGEYFGTAYCTAKFATRGFVEALQMELLEKGLNDIVLTSIYPYFVNTNFIGHLEEPFSTFFDVVSLERCSEEVVVSILKERMDHFIPGGLRLLCVYLKCLTTKGVLGPARKIFNFTYKPKTPEKSV